MARFPPLLLSIMVRDAVSGEQLNHWPEVDWNKPESREWVLKKVLVWAMFHNATVTISPKNNSV